MTILFDRKSLEILGKEKVYSLSYEIKVLDDIDMVTSESVKLLESERPVLVVAEGLWKWWNRLKKNLIKGGLNPFLIEVVDTLELNIVKDRLDPISIVIAKYSALLNFMAHRAGYISRIDKSVDRRTLLRRPHTVMLEYLPTPILLNEDACRRWRYCDSCVHSCPFNAIEGKPPTILVDRCTGCGLCVSSCPFGLLYMPQYNLKAYESFLSVLRSRLTEEPARVVVVCKESLRDLSDLLDKESDKIYPLTFFISVECPGWFTQYHMVASLLQGFSPLLYCEKEVAKRCGGEDRVRRWAEELSVIHPIRISNDPNVIVEILKEKPEVKIIRNVTMLNQDKKATLRLLREYDVNYVKFSSPLIANVVVDKEKCLVCDACSNMCPFNALRLRTNGDKRVLEFSLERCTACGICNKICPYNAIELRYEYDKKNDYDWRVIAEDRVARCKRCGRPIGSYKLLKTLEKKLRESGADPWIIESLWLCQDCKVRALIERGMNSRSRE